MDIKPYTELHVWEQNPRNINDEDYYRLKTQMLTLTRYKPLIALEDGTVIGGNMRLKVIQDVATSQPETIQHYFKVEADKEITPEKAAEIINNFQNVKVSNVRLFEEDGRWVAEIDGERAEKTFKTKEDAMMEIALSDNDRAGYYDKELILNMIPNLNIDLGLYSLDTRLPDTIEDLLRQIERGDLNGKLLEDFIVPPFSVLDARQGYWQQRKNWWKNKGIESLDGREDDLIWETNRASDSEVMARIKDAGAGTSIFDPVLAELVYRWFNIPNGKILDPFAGGSVRGIVAGMLEQNYLGIDLSEKQVEANRAQWEALRGEYPSEPVKWVVGNSLALQSLIEPDYKADLIFSCPPYFDLEKYTDNPEDLSNLNGYGEFINQYRAIINAAVGRLNDNRFAVFVVGDIRDGKGIYRNFVGDTVRAFLDAGLNLYNEAILVTTVGSLPVRVRGAFTHNRKLGKSHQNVLVFYKGDPEQIRNNYPEDIKFGTEEKEEEPELNGLPS